MKIIDADLNIDRIDFIDFDHNLDLDSTDQNDFNFDSRGNSDNFGLIDK